MRKGTWARLIGALIVVVLLVVLVVQNTASVSVEMWFWTVTGPLVILILVIGVLGFILGAIAARTRLKNRSKSDGKPDDR